MRTITAGASTNSTTTNRFNGSWRADDKLNASWQSSSTAKGDESSESSDKASDDHNPCPWSTQEMLTGRPDDYVGGYSPAWILNYRRQQERLKLQGKK